MQTHYRMFKINQNKSVKYYNKIGYSLPFCKLPPHHGFIPIYDANPPGTNYTFCIPRGVDNNTPNWYPIPIPDDQFFEKRGTHHEIGTQHQNT